MEEKDYNDYTDMFESDGWKLFVKSVDELEEHLTKAAVDSATTNDQWQYMRGQLHQLRSIIGYENYIKLNWDEQAKADE